MCEGSQENQTCKSAAQKQREQVICRYDQIEFWFENVWVLRGLHTTDGCPHKNELFVGKKTKGCSKVSLGADYKHEVVQRNASARM
jgi:hypothetical protein